MKPILTRSKNQPTAWRRRAALMLGGGLLAVTLPVLFLASPVAAQSTVNQTAVTQLLRSVIELQVQVMQSGDRHLLTQSQALLDQVRSLMTAIQTGSPLPDTSSSDTDTETTEADDASNESEGDEVTNNPSDETSSEETGDTTSGQTDDDTTNGDWESTMVNGVTICPELDITERQLRAYVDGAYGLERQHLISGYGRNIPDGVECLGEAIMRNCDDAKADHVDGYTFYVTKGSSAYNSPIFGTQRCYIGMSETGDEEHAATCNLLSIADRPHDSGSFYAWNELEWYLKVTLPEFMADHAFPLDGSHGYIGGGRDRERGGLYYFGNDPVERLASRMECRYQAINFDREED